MSVVLHERREAQVAPLSVRAESLESSTLLVIDDFTFVGPPNGLAIRLYDGSPNVPNLATCT